MEIDVLSSVLAAVCAAALALDVFATDRPPSHARREGGPHPGGGGRRRRHGRDEGSSRLDPLPEEVAREVLGKWIALLRSGLPRGAVWAMVRGMCLAAADHPGPGVTAAGERAHGERAAGDGPFGGRIGTTTEGVGMRVVRTGGRSASAASASAAAGPGRRRSVRPGDRTWPTTRFRHGARGALLGWGKRVPLPGRAAAAEAQRRSTLLREWAAALAEAQVLDDAGHELRVLADSGPGRAWSDFVWAVGLSTRSGAPMADLVQRVADDCSARAEACRARVSGLAAARSTRRILAWLPLGGLVLARLLGTDPVGVLIGTPGGRVCALLGAVFWGASILWSRRIMRARSAGRGVGSAATPSAVWPAGRTTSVQPRDAGVRA